jgi:hypothetical protein
MSERRILYLTQHQLQAFRCEGGRCLPDGDFAAETASSVFVSYLKGHAQSIFTLVVNIAEEGFQQETIPYVQRSDRSAIVDRKLGQAFFGAPLSIAVSLGHEKTTRRNERLLLTALTSPAILDPWLNALRATEARVAGIHSLPSLTETLLNRLKLPKERAVFVTVQDSTIRQSFIDKGRLVFSRVSPLSNSSVSGLTANLTSELARLQQYLQSQRLIARGEGIIAHVLVHPQVRAALDPEQAPNGIRVNPIDLHQAANRIGLKDLPDDSRAQNLYLQIAAKLPPVDQFAPLALRKPYILWRVGKAMQAFGAITALSCGMYAGKLHLDEMRVRDKAQELNLVAADKERRYQSVLSTFPPMPLGNDTLRQVVDRLETIQKSDRTPDPMLRHLARALDRVPQIELAQIDWQGLPANQPAEVQKPSTPPAAADESLLVRGTISVGRNSTPRQLVDALDQFLDQLRSNPALEVAVLKQPFDTTSAKMLTSGEGNEGASDKPREFELRLRFARTS